MHLQPSLPAKAVHFSRHGVLGTSTHMTIIYFTDHHTCIV